MGSMCQCGPCEVWWPSSERMVAPERGPCTSLPVRDSDAEVSSSSTGFLANYVGCNGFAARKGVERSMGSCREVLGPENSRVSLLHPELSCCLSRLY